MSNLNTNNMKNEFIHILSEGFTVEDLNILKSLDPSCLGTCDPKSFFKRFHQMKLNISKPKSEHPFLPMLTKIENGEHTMSKQNCDFIFSLFLFHASKLVTHKFYNILAIFFSHLRECLNLVGYNFLHLIKESNEKFSAKDVLSDLEIFNESFKKDEYCDNENAEDVPYVANFFILWYLPKNSKLFDQDLAIQIMIDFVRFLNKNNFSQKKLEFNSLKLDETISFYSLFEKRN